MVRRFFRKPKKINDVLLAAKPDRRILFKVPDKEGVRSTVDRRRIRQTGAHGDYQTQLVNETLGRRYLVDYAVAIVCTTAGKRRQFSGRGIDMSTTGMLLAVAPEVVPDLAQADSIQLKFTITAGSMPEGYEMDVAIKATLVRCLSEPDGTTLCGVAFEESLAQYAAKKKDRYLLPLSALLLFMITAFILLMRAESVLYFEFNKTLYAYSLIAAAFLLTRYLFAVFYRPVPVDPAYTPGVSIIIPCFNEEAWIQRTILGCINQDYPIDKLEVIVVDDCSHDQSPAKIEEIIAELNSQNARYDIDRRIHFVRQPQNAGKREALAKGALLARHDLVVFVDSDSFLDPFAIRHLVQPFKDGQMGGVSGRTDVANTYTNALTKMQAVRYYIAFRVMKAAESCFDAVTCLSGPLSCYRKDLVLQHLDAWLNQRFWGEKATFGDDRSMTNFILRHHRTAYQDSAVCHTIVPNDYGVFLKQQMRWKRSWLRESLIAGSFMWKKEPLMALTFYMGVLVPVLAPFIVLYNLLYIPLAHRVWPTTFLIGIALMAFLMSAAQLLLRKSSTWVFGFWFCLYYEAVLLWQMPIAWFTFWKTTWGTRMTPADIAENLDKQRKKQIHADEGLNG